MLLGRPDPPDRMKWAGLGPGGSGAGQGGGLCGKVVY